MASFQALEDKKLNKRLHHEHLHDQSSRSCGSKFEQGTVSCFHNLTHALRPPASAIERRLPARVQPSSLVTA